MLHRPNTAREAIGRWPGILQALGIDEKHLRNKHGPCPHCGGKDRFRFDDKDGRGTWFCSQCGSGDGFALLRNLHGWEFSKAAKEVDAVLGTIQAGPVKAERSEESKLKALRNVWSQSRAVTRGDPVWRYLNARVGIEDVPADLRFHPALRYRDNDGKDLGVFPAMVARLRDPAGNGVSIHRTYLTDAGTKAPVGQVKKIMPGKPLNQAAVRLSDVGTHLGIAEGIETALAAFSRFGVPTWAATTAQLLEDWVPPAGVERVLIAGDNDNSFTGQAAAFALAKRLTLAGLTVEVRIPESDGKDWADR
ncbi:DUF7146 domain-containing protein [Lacisediminimonas profundi]|uniref:DUF7146 domain-containing protein n=1 Tax=Lacisediminimonas profundi TaxID=2603856 RepID=UPI00124BC0C3|nr:toprim domain-containing protein [Lacisediminimonas profundi]